MDDIFLFPLTFICHICYINYFYPLVIKRAQAKCSSLMGEMGKTCIQKSSMRAETVTFEWEFQDPKMEMRCVSIIFWAIEVGGSPEI